jgi:hypothetical protein
VRRRGRYFVNGRLRVPFRGYKRRSSTTEPHNDAERESYTVSLFGPEHCLTAAQARQADALLARALRERGQLRGPRLAARIAGIISAVKHKRVGDSRWGWSMHGKRGGQVIARHGFLHLRAISPLSVRASLIARRRRKVSSGVRDL